MAKAIEKHVFISPTTGREIAVSLRDDDSVRVQFKKAPANVTAHYPGGGHTNTVISPQ